MATTARDIIAAAEPVEGRAAAEQIADGLKIRFAGGMTPGDRIAVHSPSGELMDISLAGVRRDGRPAVWYAPHPVFRHWLGWLEGEGEDWVLRMEPFHIDRLQDEDVAALIRS